MAAIDSIPQTCSAIREAQFPIDIGRGAASFHLFSPSHPEYDETCKHILNQALQYHQDLWTAPRIRTVADYAKKHKIEVIVVAPPFNYDVAGRVPLFAGNGKIFISLAFYMTLSEGELLKVLDHESGHLADDKIINKLHPEYKINQSSLTREEAVKGINAILDMIEKSPSLNGKYRENFTKFKGEIFGDLNALDDKQVSNLLITMREVFRYGEEAYKKDGSWIDLTRLAQRAKIEESGFWETFKKQPFYDPTTVKHFKPNQIAFFKLAIRGASHYFANPSGKASAK